jgi:hypothetical protein
VLLVALASSIATEVHAIENALCDSSIAREQVRTLPFNEDAAACAIARLKILLQASDADAEESFRSLQNAVAGVVEKTYLDRLGTSINDYDFDAALVELEEIAARCVRNGMTHEQR